MTNSIRVPTAGFLEMHRSASLVPAAISQPFTGWDGKAGEDFSVVEINRFTKRLL